MSQGLAEGPVTILFTDWGCPGTGSLPSHWPGSVRSRMAHRPCFNCGTEEHIATVASVPWCHNCFYDAFPNYRPKDELASRRKWREQAAKGLPAPVAGEALWQSMGILLRMRRLS